MPQALRKESYRTSSSIIKSPAYRRISTLAQEFCKDDPDAILSILRRVCFITETKPTELTGQIRTRRITAARHFFVWLLYRKTELGFHRVGQLVNRDHSTIVASVQLVDGFHKDMEVGLKQPVWHENLWDHGTHYQKNKVLNPFALVSRWIKSYEDGQ